MKHLRIQSIKDIEKAIWLIYRYIPQPPKPIQKALTQAFPILALIAGTYLISMAIVPFVLRDLPIDPLASTNLFFFNIILSRILFAVMAVILFMTYPYLVKKTLASWYNIFYITLFHTFFVLVVFNPYSLLALLMTWYILFSIKPNFS